MPDIFDEVAPAAEQAAGDVFDQAAGGHHEGDVFERAALVQQKEAAGNPALDMTLGLERAANVPLWEAPAAVAEAAGSRLAPSLAKAPQTFRRDILNPVIGEGRDSFGSYLGEAARQYLGRLAGGRLAGAGETAGEFATGLTTPLNIAAAGAGGKVAGLIFAGEGARSVPESIRALAAASTPEQQGAAAVNLAGAGLMTVGGALGAMHGEAKSIEKPVRVLKVETVKPAVLSEFGGEAPIVEAPTPEAPSTLAAQLEQVSSGRRNAMLLTPGEGAPAELPPGLATHATPAGTFVFHPERISPESLDAAVQKNRIGEVLGYGIGEKPEGEAVAVTQRAADGTVVNSVLTDGKRAPDVFDALGEQAGPGDTLEVQTPEQVVTERANRRDAETRSPEEIAASQARVAKTVERLRQRRARQGDGPPDLIDTVQNELGAPISLESARALQEDFQHTGELKDLFSKDGRYGVDDARQIAEAAGFKFESDEEFLSALRDNAEARKGAKTSAQREAAVLKNEERAQLEQDKLVDAAWPIAEEDMPTIEERLDRLKIQTNGALHAFGIIPEVWNAGIDLAKLAVRAGKSIAEAVEAALKHFREQKQTFDEAQVRAHLVQQFEKPTRQYGEKVAASERLDSRVQAGVSEYTYDPRSNEQDRAAAQRIIAQAGLEQATALYKDERNNLPAAVRSMLGDTLLEEMATQQQIAEKSGNKIQSDQLIRQQVDLIDHELKRSTEIAQGLQAMRRYGLMSAPALVRHAKRTIEEGSHKAIGEVKPIVDQVRKELDAGSREAATAVTQDPVVNRVARAAVDETVRGSEETHRAVVMEITGAWATSPVIVNTLRQQLHGKFDALVRRQAGTSADVRARLEAMMREAMDRVMSIANAHYQMDRMPGTGADFSRTLAEKIADRTGLAKPLAESIAKKLDAEFAKMVEAAQQKLNQRIANQRARQLAGQLGGEKNPVDAAIRKQLRDLNLKLGEVVRNGRAEETGATLADRVVKESGLTGEAAERLRTVFADRFKQLATEAKRRRLESMGRDVSVPKHLREGWEKLIEQHNLGGFSDEQLYNLVREKMKLPAWTPELAAEITRRANEIRTKPEGFQKQRAVMDLLNHIEKTKGLRWYDLPMGFWYANILSGVTTHAKNVLSTGLNTAAHVGINIALNPAATPAILESLGRGFMKGVADAGDVLRTGMTTGTRLPKLEPSRALELKQFTGMAAPLNAWKYIFRAMAAEDLLFFKPAEEMKATLASRILAKREGLSGKALEQRTRDILGHVEARRPAAQVQARNEGLRGLDFRRRVDEILEQSRPEALRESARDYALRVTFNGKPYGMLGTIAEGLNSMRAKAPVLNSIVPFVNIVANVVNESLNYVPPIGAARALYGHWSGKLEGKPITDHALLHEQYAKALLGTAALTGLAVLAAKHEDEADPAFAITGAGPNTPERRKQLQGTGWIPYSVKIHGRYYSYATTPMAIPLAALGGFMDARKYRHIDQTDALNQAAVALTTGGKVITEQSFLNGLADVFNLFNREPSKNSATGVARWASRVAVAGTLPNVARQLDQFFDPTVRDAGSVQTILINQVTFARRLNRPAINALGDPVQRYVSDTFTSADRGDDLLNLLTEKQAWPSAPDRDVIIGDKTVPGGFRILDDDEFYDHVARSGRMIRTRLDAERAYLRALPADAAKKEVQHVVTEERKASRDRFSPVK